MVPVQADFRRSSLWIQGSTSPCCHDNVVSMKSETAGLFMLMWEKTFIKAMKMLEEDATVRPRSVQGIKPLTTNWALLWFHVSLLWIQYLTSKNKSLGCSLPADFPKGSVTLVVRPLNNRARDHGKIPPARSHLVLNNSLFHYWMNVLLEQKSAASLSFLPQGCVLDRNPPNHTEPEP